MKRKISRHRGGPEDKRVGSEVASLQQPSGVPPCSPSLCNPVDEKRLAAMGWLSSSSPLEGRWHYVCRGGSRDKRGGSEEANLWRPTLNPASVPSSGWGVDSLHGVAGL